MDHFRGLENPVKNHSSSKLRVVWGGKPGEHAAGGKNRTWWEQACVNEFPAEIIVLGGAGIQP